VGFWWISSGHNYFIQPDPGSRTGLEHPRYSGSTSRHLTSLPPSTNTPARPQLALQLVQLIIPSYSLFTTLPTTRETPLSTQPVLASELDQGLVIAQSYPKHLWPP
jgi:hypothetical protein